MTRERWQQIQDLFYAASELPAGSRGEFLRHSCNGDATLQQHIEDLIASEKAATGFLQDTLRETADAMIAARPGDRLGPYRIIGELGHGGMGDVYLAERDDEQFQMRVAIKVIRSDAAPQRLLARFRAERQILATLQHPNIARLLDGGTAGASPFLVMEYVEGEPIDRYCTRLALSIRERLQLFRAVSEAVAYAHRNLVIHRDIKPSNILVTAEGVPKLLDFGIAKLINADDGADGLTRPLERVMTPAYASPEVVRGERVTTAADVYSLGALLFELLTGRAPFHLTSSQALEVERVVCRQEPPPPGTLDRRLRGDLENIILMAMHKEPARRYASVEQLIADLDRYLTGYPVAARSDRLYRWGKFARRNRGAMAACALALAGIAGWLVSLKAEQARTHQGFAQVRELAESLLFETDDALRPVAGTTAAREMIVKRGLRYLDGLSRQAGADRKLEDELADAYERVADIQFSPGPNLAQPAGALDSSRKALAIRQALAASSPQDRRLQRKLAVNYLRLSGLQQLMGDAAGAQQSFRTANRILDELSRAAPGDPVIRLDLAGLYLQEAQRQYQTANFAQGRTLVAKAQDLSRSVLASDPRSRDARRRIADGDLMSLENMGATRYSIPSGDRQTALATYHDAEEILTRLAAESPVDLSLRMTLMSLYTRGCGLTNLLEPSAQITACRKSTLIADELAAADPASVAARLGAINAHHNLAGRMQEMGEEGAMAEVRRATELADQLFAERPDVIAARSVDALEHQGFAELLTRTPDRSNALFHARKAIQVRELLLADANDTRPRVAQSRGYGLIGDLEMSRQNFRGAIDAYQSAVKLLTELKDEHKLDANGERDLAHVRQRMAECTRQ